MGSLLESAAILGLGDCHFFNNSFDLVNYYACIIFSILAQLQKQQSLKPEETVDFHIKRTWQSIAKMYNEVAAGYGATMATGYVLLNIDKETGTPSTALGPKMGMEATSLSRILKSMQEKGLIERRPNPNDGRSVLVFLTPFGIEKRKDAKAAVINFNQQVAERFPEADLATFFRVIMGIEEMLQEHKMQPKI